jgi:thymidylate kinase
MPKGYFIVCEGLDAAGKTTTLGKILAQNPESDMKYNKGLKSSTIMGKISSRIPSTLTLLAELLYEDNTIIKKSLGHGQTILQDRWYYSVLSYNNKKEKLLEKLFVPRLTKPDALIYFSVSPEERIRRLKRRDDSASVKELQRYPEILQDRERRMIEYYNSFKGPKAIIDTTNSSEAESARILYSLIQSIVEKK